ncbi:MAG: ribonuclease P protein component [Nocardioidaceae bacterium]
MLSKDNRLRRSTDFQRTVRRGRRVAAPTVVVHLMSPQSGATEPVKAGFVVSKAVGPAVVRNRVKRQLRHAMRDRIVGLDAGTMLVIRANPAAARAGYRNLDSDLERCLTKLDKEQKKLTESRGQPR